MVEANSLFPVNFVCRASDARGLSGEPESLQVAVLLEVVQEVCIPNMFCKLSRVFCKYDAR